jgi:thiol-disulfide isomerase/thioredoxin
VKRALVAFAVGCAAALGLPANAADLEPIASLPPAPALLQQALDAARGKVVVVNFWASWCPPCRSEMPGLVDLDEREPGVVLVTVAVADREADTRRFLADNLLDAVTVVADPDQTLARAWGARMLPTTILLDARHRPRLRVRGEADWYDPALRAKVRALAESKGPTP